MTYTLSQIEAAVAEVRTAAELGNLPYTVKQVDIICTALPELVAEQRRVNYAWQEVTQAILTALGCPGARPESPYEVIKGEVPQKITELVARVRELEKQGNWDHCHIGEINAELKEQYAELDRLKDGINETGRLIVLKEREIARLKEQAESDIVVGKAASVVMQQQLNEIARLRAMLQERESNG